METIEEKIAEDQAAVDTAQATLKADTAEALAVTQATADASTADPAAVGNTNEAVPVAPKTIADAVIVGFDNEHPDGVHCTVTFRDGTEATGIAPLTGTLLDAQTVATAAAIASVA